MSTSEGKLGLVSNRWSDTQRILGLRLDTLRADSSIVSTHCKHSRIKHPLGEYWICAVHGGNCCQSIKGLCCQNNN